MSDDDPIDSRLRADGAAWRADASPQPNEERLVRAATHHQRWGQASRARPGRITLAMLSAAAAVVLVSLGAVIVTSDRSSTPNRPNAQAPGGRSSSSCSATPRSSATSGAPMHPSVQRSLTAIAAATALSTTASCAASTRAHVSPSATRTAPTLSGTVTPTGQTSSQTRTSTTPTPTSSSVATESPGPFVSGDECQTAQLRLTLDSQSNGVAGETYRLLLLTNTSKVTCVTEGYPGLSVIDSSGKIVQHAATRHTGLRSLQVKQVTIAPGQTGYILWTSVDLQDPPDCSHQFHGARLQVYPPDNTVALYLPFTGNFCDLGVGPITDAKDAHA